MEVNFIDLKMQYLSIKEEVDGAIQAVIDSSAFASGPFVKSFEENFAKAHGAKYCVAVNSGTSALHVALWAHEIGRGDEVIIPANTFFATPEAVSLTGADPVFVDCEPDFYNIDIQKIEEAISDRTKAIVVVHLYGQPAKLDEAKLLAEKHNILLIEDCAQAHLAEYKNIPVGTHGECGCFSFYPGKNLGAFGEGGAVMTNDESIFLKMRALRDHGSSKKYHHDYIGHNYRMDGIQGAVLDIKLRYLNEWTEKRRQHAALYRKYLKDIEEISLPVEITEVRHVYHLFVLRARNRDDLMKYLKANNIFTGIHYPIPCHLQKAYLNSNKKNLSCPVSESYAKEIVSLPMYAELTEREIKYVSEKIRDYYKSKI